ncbi:DHH family phosphoesterase [Streptococcus sciuri]|uniref:Bifunctional oligoribonuclease/PAP phosphatase NrnA n=1 Tax=Streptococcus sciuri TaxID=2973939 RepID=A0ABT2F4G7_9STRE|nr:bifunctional oligoribonuclease/PAP phosphatase NrnA [Streptococcus sciuri]MCS4487369.1 bifunctional oligoribonuclease/PAP phosphatase NrnA [Streptococcus sciuri]
MFREILAKIEYYHTIIIHRHMKPDPDALGSQVGLKKIITHNFPDKRVLVTGHNEPTLDWITHMDEVTDSDYQDALVIVTDTANTPRIDDKRYASGAFLIKIDHHPNDDSYGDICYVDTTASSTSEIICDFAQTVGLSLSDEAARLLYIGIIGDTGRFLYPATSSKTLAIASYLRQFPFDFSALSRQMDSFPLKIAKLQGYVFEHLEIDPTGAACVLLTQEILKKFDVTDAETAAIVGSPGKIDSIKAWAIFVEQADKHYRVRLRSKDKVINAIAKRHDGGGHPLASGANSYSAAENAQIFQELKELFL